MKGTVCVESFIDTCIDSSHVEAEVKSASSSSQTTWTGWAVGAITSKFYKTSIGAQPQKQVISGTVKGSLIIYKFLISNLVANNVYDCGLYCVRGCRYDHWIIFSMFLK